VHAYARRHVGAQLAEDVVAETFTIAWRRWAVVPDPALPWLLVVARNVVSNQQRSFARADRMWSTAVHELWHQTDPDDPQDLHVDRASALEALAACTPRDREALLLVAWDGLSAIDAAAVAGCSPRAFTVRLSRARQRFARALEVGTDATATPVPQFGRAALPEETR
jgi:RNA polymerase sigma-70 factor (ECF subfamily)